jgi:ferredoxin-thioredoxin reductase catalytic subunit
MLCRYDVFIFGGVDEEWKHFLGPCCKVDDEIKTASDVACTLYLFAAKLNSLGKRCFHQRRVHCYDLQSLR